MGVEIHLSRTREVSFVPVDLLLSVANSLTVRDLDNDGDTDLIWKGLLPSLPLQSSYGLMMGPDISPVCFLFILHKPSQRQDVLSRKTLAVWDFITRFCLQSAPPLLRVSLRPLDPANQYEWTPRTS